MIKHERYCVTWSERPQFSEDTRYLFGLEDDEEESSFTRFDSLASRRVRDVACPTAEQIQCIQSSYCITGSHICWRRWSGHWYSTCFIGHKGYCTKWCSQWSPYSRRQRETAPSVKSREEIDQWQCTVPWSIRKHVSKTFGNLYKTTVSTKQHEMKSVKADRKLIQQLLNAVLVAGQLKWIQSWNFFLFIYFFMSLLQFRYLELRLEVICIQPLKQNSLTS